MMDFTNFIEIVKSYNSNISNEQILMISMTTAYHSRIKHIL